MVDGVVLVYEDEEAVEPVSRVGAMGEYYKDLFEIKRIINYGPIKLLEARFTLHTRLGSERELMAQKPVLHRGFYNVRMVDTHIYHSARSTCCVLSSRDCATRPERLSFSVTDAS
ncbi:hypothetical protein V7S43_015769 [Phytophthora oleae]|uniref:Uncharacterized protein n=1 Tax=Phytophthora oleae TaxID=2107226 RepID=A0ABD3EYA9_9STRA